MFGIVTEKLTYDACRRKPYAHEFFWTKKARSQNIEQKGIQKCGNESEIVLIATDVKSNADCGEHRSKTDADLSRIYLQCRYLIYLDRITNLLIITFSLHTRRR